jgi:hypothetical protein
LFCDSDLMCVLLLPAVKADLVGQLWDRLLLQRCEFTTHTHTHTHTHEDTSTCVLLLMAALY